MNTILPLYLFQVNVTITFETNTEKFHNAIAATFGTFKRGTSNAVKHCQLLELHVISNAV